MTLATRILIGILAVAGPLLATPATAELAPITSDPAQSWTHAESGVSFPATARTFTREAIEDSTKSQSDVVVSFRDRATRTLASVFLFRAGIADASLWQDRVLRQLLRPDNTLGTIDGTEARETTFTPAGHGANSGSRIVFPVRGKETTATGSAVFAIGGWIIAVRMTSRQLSAAELDAQLGALVDAFSLPKSNTPRPAFYRIADCLDRSLPEKPAKRADNDLTGLLMLSAIQVTAREQVAKRNEKDAHQSPAPLCRLAAGGTGFDVYRTGESRDRFLIAFGDAGVVAEVGPDPSAAMLNKGKRIGLTLITSEQVLFYRGFKSTPSISQAVDVINSENPAGGSGRTPQNSKTINISPSGK